jgi:hypothetical protein
MFTKESTRMAHRLAWMLVHGDIPDGLMVLHRCDNPPCCNVDHLFLGTRADNMHDMSVKGRARVQKFTEKELLRELSKTKDLDVVATNLGVKRGAVVVQLRRRPAARELYNANLVNVPGYDIPGKGGKRLVRTITAFGETKRVCEWARETGVPDDLILSRLRSGYTPEKALSRGSLPRLSQAKLTHADVAFIKRDLAAGITPREIADALGLTWEAVADIRKGKTWSQVEALP